MFFRRKIVVALALAQSLFVVVEPGATAAETCPASAAHTFSTSSTTTDHVTDLPPVQQTVVRSQTRAVAIVVGVTVFDRTVTGDADSRAAVDVVRDAERAARDANASPDGIATGTAVSTSTTTSSADKLVETVDHTTTTVTTEDVAGPATVRIGPDRTRTLVVPAGSCDTNTNTHADRFVQRRIVTTVTTTTRTTVTINVDGTVSQHEGGSVSGFGQHGRARSGDAVGGQVNTINASGDVTFDQSSGTSGARDVSGDADGSNNGRSNRDRGKRDDDG